MLEYRGRELPTEWHAGAGGRVYAKYRHAPGGGLIRMIAGKDAGAGWRWKAEVMEDSGDVWLPYGGSTAALPTLAQAQAAADSWLASIKA